MSGTDGEFWQTTVGSGAPPAPMSDLRAGPLAAVLDGTEVRYLRLDDVELIRRLYVAVRDPLWGTVPGIIQNLVVEISELNFEVSFDARHHKDDISFGWHGSIVGDQNGVVTMSMSGRAERDLVYNRVGMCLLLPASLAGRPLRGRGPGGAWRGRFPSDIGPQRSDNGTLVALHPASHSLEVDLTSGANFVLEFAGDLFESEDQRNWTDASFKTYSTPMALGLPRRCPAGALIEQSVVLRVEGGPGPPSAPVAPRRLQLRVGEPTGGLVPRVGLGLGSPPPLHSAEQLDLLAALRPAHLRLDCHVGSEEWERDLQGGVRVCDALGADLELALFLLPGPGAANLDRLRDALVGVPVARLLVFSDGALTNSAQETSPPELIALARACFGPRFPIVAGTDLNFCELNRTRPDMATIDGVAWPMTPQVHAFDDSSIIETPEAQADQVATAHHFAPGRPLFVGPVTLLPRYNPNVGGHRGPRPADGRQPTLFGAAFTLSSLEQLSEAGIDAVTYYETIGPGGVMTGESGAVTGEGTGPGQRSSAFPLFHVLADAAAMAGREVLAVRSNRPLTVTGLAAGGPDGTTLLVANTTPTSIVELVGVPSQGAIRRLNAATAGSAGLEPVLFRSRLERFEGDMLALQAYETVRLEFAP